MLRWIALCGFFVGSHALAQTGGVQQAELCPVPIGGDGGLVTISDWQPPFLRDTAVGARPHGGARCDPSEGYNHYDLPSKHYGLWFRPAAFAEDRNEHCKSRIFAPRGYGWGNRLDCTQIDYHPYVVRELPSVHGPSYYNRPPREPCHCCLQGHGARRGALVR